MITCEQGHCVDWTWPVLSVCSLSRTIACPWLSCLPSLFRRIQDLSPHPDPRSPEAVCGGEAGANVHGQHGAQRGHRVQLDALRRGPGQSASLWFCGAVVVDLRWSHPGGNRFDSPRATRRNRDRNREICFPLPPYLANIRDFLLSGIHRSVCAPAGQRWPRVLFREGCEEKGQWCIGFQNLLQVKIWKVLELAAGLLGHR